MNWSRFDRRVVLGFTGMRDRMEPMLAELGRVGMEAVVQWGVPNPYESWAFPLERYPHSRWVENHRRHISTTLGHYRAVRAALDLGFSNLLVMEDDVRFLLDPVPLQKCVDTLPEDYDLALLDSFAPGSPRNAKEWHDALVASAGGGCWGTADNAESAGCYALSRRGMEHLVHILERPAVEGGPWGNVDNFWDARTWAGYSRWIACPNAAVQVDVTGDSVSGDAVFSKYAIAGVSRSDYGG